MKYTSESIWIEPQPSSATIKDVVLTGTKLSVDFREKGEDGHLQAASTDGVNYEGNYGYPKPIQEYEFECKRFDAADGEILLYGEYRDRLESEQGHWLIRLRPAETSPKRGEN
jgi:hypothetical protein